MFGLACVRLCWRNLNVRIFSFELVGITEGSRTQTLALPVPTTLKDACEGSARLAQASEGGQFQDGVRG